MSEWHSNALLSDRAGRICQAAGFANAGPGAASPAGKLLPAPSTHSLSFASTLSLTSYWLPFMLCSSFLCWPIWPVISLIHTFSCAFFCQKYPLKLTIVFQVCSMFNLKSLSFSHLDVQNSSQSLDSPVPSIAHSLQAYRRHCF